MYGGEKQIGAYLSDLKSVAIRRTSGESTDYDRAAWKALTHPSLVRVVIDDAINLTKRYECAVSENEALHLEVATLKVLVERQGGQE